MFRKVDLPRGRDSWWSAASEDENDWLRVRDEFSAHAQKIRPSQRSRFWVLTKRSAASEDENAQKVEFNRRNSNQPRSQGLSYFSLPGGQEDEKPWERG